jgi:chaperonin cofactor prefoldin
MNNYNNKNTGHLVVKDSEFKDFETNIQKWSLIETQLKTVNEKIKVIRDSKNELTEKICKYIEENNLKDTRIEISDGVVKLFEKKEYPPLTYTYLEESLNKIITNKQQVEYIIKYLKENREIKRSLDLKKIQVK